jgi:hypothetical protein
VPKQHTNCLCCKITNQHRDFSLHPSPGSLRLLRMFWAEYIRWQQTPRREPRYFDQCLLHNDHRGIMDWLDTVAPKVGRALATGLPR